uniref:Mitochondrial carrier family n=1 Tax=Tetraselmis sp. GSL018 TaxID=582737 RepID=A0A061R0Q2_9CHLO|mmetsp:Transcript_2883/g.6768  ORF Transcript_2883/g.6768 Transcript_2883/m.6768 type:complete len:305 (+) Transcript_2883:401-1315(+)|eukprot:CAMPEP_0177608790 /NCGR_PEP_ID=MMETSP0419_2-20121207/18676_1 /TAXON_ID=582737 /ORGANISM="Tetraselmis sp., Strain GSL018" /LENGTH=304 /DNA_ID=CAMNT_0019103537 /DNA_START=344 /DNA_END=1258 /DNA_ORIENTATION=+
MDDNSTGSNSGAETSAGEFTVFRSLTVGALSGMLARIFIHPADTVKAQLQVQGCATSKRYANTLNAVLQIASSEGISGFYRGFNIVLLGTAPGNMAYFGGYEFGKLLVPTGSGFFGDLAVGAAAQLVAGAVYNPFDIIKERLQAQVLMRDVYSYKGTREAMAHLLRRGRPADLLRGYWVTNLAWIPWNAIYIAGYEAARQGAAARLCRSGSVEDLPSWAVASCAFTAASGAALVTSPADVVKTRLQVLAAAHGSSGLNARRVAWDIWRKEGFRGFFAGSLPRVLSIASESAIVWLLYEKLKSSL